MKILYKDPFTSLKIKTTYGHRGYLCYIEHQMWGNMHLSRLECVQNNAYDCIDQIIKSCTRIMIKSLALLCSFLMECINVTSPKHLTRMRYSLNACMMDALIPSQNVHVDFKVRQTARKRSHLFCNSIGLNQL